MRGEGADVMGRGREEGGAGKMELEIGVDRHEWEVMAD